MLVDSPHYEGFEPVFKRTLLVPTSDNTDLCIGYNENAILSRNREQAVRAGWRRGSGGLFCGQGGKLGV